MIYRGLLFIFPLVLAACAANPRIGEIAVTTPEHYTENKVVFALDDLNGTRRELKHAYELPNEAGREVERLKPLGVIIRGVRLPSELKQRRDVAVVLDVVTAGPESVTSIVAFYQRDVPGGQMLNFQDLLVYYDPEWDGVTPPWFRVRVMEVNAERNTRTRAFLDESSKLSGSLAGMVPHPVLPTVRTAIEAARLILGNQRNKIIVDYQVQFYSRAHSEGANTRLTPLRKGEWLVVGRARGATSEFWNTQLTLDVRTGTIHQSVGDAPVGEPGPDPTLMQVPYVALVLMSADASVPKHILDRSQALLEVLDSPTERANFDSLASSLTQLNSAVRGYTYERRIKKYRSRQDFQELIGLLKDYQASVNDGDPILLTAQVRTLVRLASDLVQDQTFGSVDEILAWWKKDRNADGTFDVDEAAPYGVVWKAPS